MSKLTTLYMALALLLGLHAPGWAAPQQPAATQAPGAAGKAKGDSPAAGPNSTAGPAAQKKKGAATKGKATEAKSASKRDSRPPCPDDETSKPDTGPITMLVLGAYEKGKDDKWEARPDWLTACPAKQQPAAAALCGLSGLVKFVVSKCEIEKIQLLLKNKPEDLHHNLKVYGVSHRAKFLGYFELYKGALRFVLFDVYKGYDKGHEGDWDDPPYDATSVAFATNVRDRIDPKQKAVPPGEGSSEHPVPLVGDRVLFGQLGILKTQLPKTWEHLGLVTPNPQQQGPQLTPDLFLLSGIQRITDESNRKVASEVAKSSRTCGGVRAALFTGAAISGLTAITLGILQATDIDVCATSGKQRDSSCLSLSGKNQGLTYGLLAGTSVFAGAVGGLTWSSGFSKALGCDAGGL